MKDDDKLFYEDIAKLRGVAVSTVRVDNAKARQVRRAASPDAVPKYIEGRQDMPEHDGTVRNSPYWLRSTIMPWINSRAMPSRAAAE